MKGSELNKLEKNAEMKRLLLEFTEKLQDDPYQPGIVHPELCSDEVQEIIEDVIFVRGHKSVLIKVTPSKQEGYIDVEVIERSQADK